MNRPFASLLLALLIVVSSVRANAQWAQFRGPNGSGVDASPGYPAEFSPKKNLVWKASVPYGQSSPIVVDGRLYLTASEGERLITISIDTTTGKEMWRREVRREHVQTAYKANDPASPTPAADGNGVVAFFPEFGLIAYNKDGQQRWTHQLGPFRNFYGMSGSPIIAGDKVILVCDQLAQSFVVALDRSTGKVRWRTERPGAMIAWSTPMVFHPNAARSDVIVLGSTRLDAYDLATGAERWWLPIGSNGALGTPLADGDTLIVSTDGTNEPMMPLFASVLAQYDKNNDGKLSYEEFRGDKDLGEHFGWIDVNDDKVIVDKEWNVARSLGLGDWGAIAIRAGDGKGQLAPSAIKWRFQKNIPYIPAPLLYQGVCYMVKDGGIITTLDPVTGKLIKEGRSREAIGSYYASPVAADGKVFLANTEGKVTVLKAAGDWEVLAVNELDEEISATPALSGGRVYLRTRGSMYCFGNAR
jgi:outer membrane protein assembly factor BamB